MARAASTARATSALPISRFLPWTATTPWLFTPRRWLPPIAVNTDSISTPAICSASATARLMPSTVASMLATTPFRRPRAACWPMPITSTPVGVSSAMTAHTLVVPTSRPVIVRGFGIVSVAPAASDVARLGSWRLGS